jgi:hypothetical protein
VVLVQSIDIAFLKIWRLWKRKIENPGKEFEDRLNDAQIMHFMGSFIRGRTG